MKNQSIVLSIENSEFEFRALSNDEEIRAAEALLYYAYVLEQGWYPADNNPSQLKIVGINSSLKILTDYYSDISYWFGAFFCNQLIGCFRVIPYPLNEVSKYITIPSFLNNGKASELNRLCIIKKFRNHRFVMLFLMRIAFDYAFSIGNIAFCTATIPSPASLFGKCGLSQSGFNFRYHYTERYSATILFHDTNHKDRFDTALYKFSDRLMEKFKITLEDV